MMDQLRIGNTWVGGYILTLPALTLTMYEDRSVGELMLMLRMMKVDRVPSKYKAMKEVMLPTLRQKVYN